MTFPCIFAGRTTLDLIYGFKGYPPEDTKLMAAKCLSQAGGPALNGAITFSILGGMATLISAVGSGPFSQVVLSELQNYSVNLMNCCDLHGVNPPISSVVLNLENGSRTIFNSPDPDFEGPWIEAAAPEAPMLMLDGFYIPQFRGLIQHFFNEKQLICLDAGSWKITTEALLPFISIAICGERFIPPNTSNSLEVIDYLHHQGVKQVAITGGGRPIIGSDHGRSFTIPIEVVEVVDTLGAGDILHGAFCWYYLHGNNFEEALQKAAALASLSCKFLGARQWIQSFKGV